MKDIATRVQHHWLCQTELDKQFTLSKTTDE